MYELVQAGEATWYIECPARIGVAGLQGNDVALIDSGGDREAGRRVRRILEERGWRLALICNTHANADHTGGNRYLQERTGCRILAPGIEAAIARHPVLEPSFLYGGYPYAELRHKFFLAEPSRAEPLEESALPDGLEAISLPGHFFGMAGYRTRDDVVFLADCLLDRRLLEKHPVPFMYDVAAYLDTLERVARMEAALFVPSHAAPTRDVAPLARENRDHVLRLAETVLELARRPAPFEELLAGLFTRFGLTLDAGQYALAGSTLRSLLSWLREKKRADFFFSDNMMLWQAKEAPEA